MRSFLLCTFVLALATIKTLNCKEECKKVFHTLADEYDPDDGNIEENNQFLTFMKSLDDITFKERTIVCKGENTTLTEVQREHLDEVIFQSRQDLYEKFEDPMRDCKCKDGTVEEFKGCMANIRKDMNTYIYSLMTFQIQKFITKLTKECN